MSVFAQMKRTTLYSDIIRFALERCNPSPHVANRHISICQLLSLWRHWHYDIIRCWAGHAQRYKRTDTLPRLIYKDITQFARSIYAKQNEWTAAFTWCCARPCIHQLVTSDCTSWSDSQPSHIPAVPVEIRPAFDNYHHNHHHRHSHRSLQHQQPDKVEVKDVILVTGVSAGCSSPFLVLLSS